MTRIVEPTHLSAALFNFGLPAWIAAGITLALGLAAAFILREHTAETRSWCNRSTLLAIAAGAVLASARFELPVLPAGRAPVTPAPILTPAPTERTYQVPKGTSTKYRNVDESPPPAARPVDWVSPALASLIVLWVMGAFVILGRLGLGVLWLRRLQLGSRGITTGPAAESLARLCASARVPVPGLRCAPQVGGPFVSGVIRPTLWLPEYFETGLDLEAQHAVLAHEIEHLRRRDNAWMLAAEILTVLLWLQPLMWLLRRHLRDAADEACDAGALRLGCRAKSYADALLVVSARLRAQLPGHAFGSAVVPFRSSLTRRVTQVLTGEGTHREFGACHVALSALLVLVALGGSTAAGAMAPRSSGAAPMSQLATRSAGLMPPDEVQKGVPFKLFVPSQIKDARVLGARYTATKLSDPDAVRDFLGERERSGMFYGMMLEFKGGKTFVRAAAKTVAADAGVPNRFVELVSVNGFRPKVPDQYLTPKLPQPKQAEASRKQGDLLMRMRAEPLKLVLRVRGKERSVLLPKRRKVVFGVERPAIIRAKSAAVLLAVPSKMELQEGVFPVTLVQTPSTVPTSLPDVQPPAHLPKNAMRRSPYGKRAWIQGSEHSPSAVYWTSNGVDYWLNNPQHLLKRHQIQEVMRQTGYKTPPTASALRVPTTRISPVKSTGPLAATGTEKDRAPVSQRESALPRTR